MRQTREAGKRGLDALGIFARCAAPSRYSGSAIIPSKGSFFYLDKNHPLIREVNRALEEQLQAQITRLSGSYLSFQATPAMDPQVRKTKTKAVEDRLPVHFLVKLRLS